MSRIFRTHNPGEPEVLRGYVEMATCALYRGPTILGSAEISRKWIPVQKSNLNHWFRACYSELGVCMRPMIGFPMEEMKIRINDGEGAHPPYKGRENKIEFITLNAEGLPDLRLVINITMVSHTVRHKGRIAAGHEPMRRINWNIRTHIDERGKVQQLLDPNTPGEFLTWEREEYYRQYPEQRGNLPMKGLPRDQQPESCRFLWD